MLISDDKTTLYEIDKSDINSRGHFRVPDGVVTIGTGSGAILEHKSKKRLKSIDINAVKTIKENAFLECSDLMQVIGSPRIIERNAFGQCVSLLKFDFSNVDELGAWAFTNSGIVEINRISLKEIAYGAFCNCVNLKRINCAPEKIWTNAFNGCKNLKTFDFSKLIVLGNNVFSYSGLDGCVTTTDKLIHINYRDYDAYFARGNVFTDAYLISGIVDSEKGLYTDLQGNPFILQSTGVRLDYKDNPTKFLQLWRTLNT